MHLLLTKGENTYFALSIIPKFVCITDYKSAVIAHYLEE